MRRDDTPPIVAKDERDKARMRSWINDQLNARWEEAEFFDIDKIPPADRKNIPEWMRQVSRPKRAERPGEKKRRALTEFRRGNVEPLRDFVREFDPELVEAINLPKMPGKGRHRERGLDRRLVDLHHRLWAAISDARRIRDIRQKLLDGKRNGPIGGMTVEEIAAERWGVTEDEVVNRRPSREKSEEIGRREITFPASNQHLARVFPVSNLHLRPILSRRGP